MKIIFLGAGYCSRFVIPKLPKTASIICTHYQEIKNQPFDSKYKLIRMKLDDLKKNQNYFKNATHILNSIPPQPDGDIILNNFKKQFLVNKKTLQWIGYFSSTSVYGDHSGRWVDENSIPKKLSKRGCGRLRVEKKFLSLFVKNELPVHILRLPGIYGPGRSIFERLKSDKFSRIVKKNHFFSRIHVDDIALALLKSFEKPTPGEIFNITDDFPCNSDEIVKLGCKLLKIKLPKPVSLHDKNVSEMTRSFYSDNKKVSNKKIKRILNWTPKFINYKLGIKDIFSHL